MNIKQAKEALNSVGYKTRSCGRLESSCRSASISAETDGEWVKVAFGPRKKDGKQAMFGMLMIKGVYQVGRSRKKALRREKEALVRVSTALKDIPVHATGVTSRIFLNGIEVKK